MPVNAERLLLTTLPHYDRRNTLPQGNRLIAVLLDRKPSWLTEASTQPAEAEAKLIGTTRPAEGWVDDGGWQQ